MEGETRYLNKSQFAAEQGWSPSYVTKLKDQERLVYAPCGKLIDVAATLAILRRTNDPGKESVRQHHAAERSDRHVGTHVRPDAPSGDEPSTGSAASPKYWDAKSRREGALGELAELELAKKRGDLVERPRVESVAFAVGRMTRDSVLGLLPRLASEVAPLTDPFEIEVKLREAMRSVFTDLAKMTDDDLAKAMEPSH